MISIQDMIDQELAKKEERIRSGKFSPSQLGRCYRAQIWNRKAEPISDPVDARTERVFKAGNIFHDFVQELVLKNDPNAKKEVLVETNDFKGYADIVLKDEVIDIKTQHSRAFWYRNGLTWEQVEPQLYPNVLQVVFYALNLGVDRARLVFLSKDDLCIDEYPFEAKNAYKAKLDLEIDTLMSFWNKNVLPPATPRCYKDKDGKYRECGFCLWKTTCKKIESVNNS